MRLRLRAVLAQNRVTLAWLGGIALVAAAAFFAGQALKPAAEQASAFDLEALPYRQTKAIAGASRGGFSGFGETPGLDGRTVIAGRVVEAGGASITLETAPGVRSTVEITGQAPLSRIEAGDRASLRPGATVVVRLGAAGDAVEALLVVSGP